MSAKSIRSFEYKNFNCGIFKDFDWVRKYIPRVRYKNNKMRFNLLIIFYFRDYVLWLQYHFQKKYKLNKK